MHPPLAAVDAAVAGAAVVCGSVFAGELVNRYLDERGTDSAEVFRPDGNGRADQPKAAIPTASVQVFRPIPAAPPQPPPMAAGTFPATGARLIVEPTAPGSGGPTIRSLGAPGTWTPPTSRDASEGNRPSPAIATPSPTPTTPPPSEDPDDSGDSEEPGPGGDNGTGRRSGDSGSGDSGNSYSSKSYSSHGESGSEKESGGDGSEGGDRPMASPASETWTSGPLAATGAE